jgi:quinol monooxygenase YgiN
MFVEVAWYRAHPGASEAVIAAMREAAARAREEPGCLAYRFHQSVDDPNGFLVYEAYVDEAAMEAHLQTAHFREIVQGRVNPLLESREWRSYRVIEP